MPALIPVGAAVVGGLISKDSARSAANKQADSTREANALQQAELDRTRADNLPLLQARNRALAGYENLLANPSNITRDPGYQFEFGQGVNALERSAAARGGLYSGNTLKALTRFGQNQASTKLDASLGRFSTLAGLGQPGAAAISSAGQNAAYQMGNNSMALGNALGQSSIAQGNALGNAFNQVGAYGQRKGWFDSAPALSGPSNAELEDQYGFSDERLKRNAKRIGTSPRGHAVYSFEWLDGSPGVGVIAQEVQAVDPSIVRERDGFLQVNYARI